MYSKNKNLAKALEVRKQALEDLAYHQRQFDLAIKEAELELQKCERHASLIKEISISLEEVRYA